VASPAIALLELDSIAIGVAAGDAMVKRAPVELIFAGTVHPGKYLVLVVGDVASVEEAHAAGAEVGAAVLLDEIMLPAVHDGVVEAVRGRRRPALGEALGVVETRTAAATVGAADRGLKGAAVTLMELRLADRLGGKAYCVFSGQVGEVEEAVGLAVAGLREPGLLVAQVVIANFHDEMLANLEAGSEFNPRVAAAGNGGR
jgi:microcompartment protein CcmL/EutN